MPEKSEVLITDLAGRSAVFRSVETFYDERLDSWCELCGGRRETREHVVARVLLVQPFPELLPTIRTCLTCNNGVSADELHVAAFVEFLLNGGESAQGERIFGKRTWLKKTLAATVDEIEGQRTIEVPWDRLTRVLEKTARCIWKYETGIPPFSRNSKIAIANLLEMSADEVLLFRAVPQWSGLVPEIGTRLFFRAVEEEKLDWVVLQAGRFEYLVGCNPDVVRILLGGVIAAELIFEGDF
jgi:hypothetical protein